jgi:hypothetical protein
MTDISEQWTALAIVLIIALLAVVGNGDLEEAERAESEYCANVDSGAWPDYRGVAAEICE